jgi:MbtH protein
MSWFDDERDIRSYRAVINHEEQYSIWLADRETPLGWRDVGKKGTKQECLDYIETVWTDLRPLTLRHSIAEFLEQKITRDAEKGKSSP